MGVLSKLKRLDWTILLILVVFMVASVLLIYSATHDHYKLNGSHSKQLKIYGLCFFVLITTSLINYRWIMKFWYVVYGFGVALLFLVYFFGSTINNSRGWFKITETLFFQPAEMMKICLIIGLAYLLSRREGGPLRVVNDLVPLLICTGLPFVAVMIQPDLGNAVIYIVIMAGMLWIGNIKYTHVAIVVTSIAVGLVVFFQLFTTFNEEIKQLTMNKEVAHWYQRINTFINSTDAPTNDSYHIDNALISVGSGGLSGTGYMKGEIKKRGLVPYTYSDSIFTIVGEEFGFQGGALLLLLYFLLIYRMIVIAFQCRDRTGAYIIVGIVSMFVFQIFENVGMMIGIMPITGITLPFISYGGTSLMLNMLSISIVLSIKIHQRKQDEIFS